MSQGYPGEQPLGNEKGYETTPVFQHPSSGDPGLDAIHNFKGAYPKQIWLLFLTEMWEHFCFYGMRGMLIVFIATKLLAGLAGADRTANLQYGAIQAFVYAFTFIGGLFADKILGFRKSLFWGGMLMIVGNFIIAASPTGFFYAGIASTIVGTGFFKPNISTMVGALYREGDPRRDAGFGLFYSGINIGAFLGGIACVGIGLNDKLHLAIGGHVFNSWSLAFASAGFAMVLGLVIFLYTQRTLGPIGKSPLPVAMPVGAKRFREIAVYAFSLAVIPVILLMLQDEATRVRVTIPEGTSAFMAWWINASYTDVFMAVVGPGALLYLFVEMRKYPAKEIRKLFAALVFIVFSVIFWAIFEQAGGSLALFAFNNVNHTLLGLPIDVNPNQVNNGANSVFVIALSPVVGLVWLALAKRRSDPNTVVKFGLAFLFLGAAYFIFYATRFFADANGMTSLNVFTLAYLVITFGELCLSPIGLSIMTKLSPKPLWGMMMGMWFLASAYGQYVAGLIGAGLADAPEGAGNLVRLENYTTGYRQLGIYALVAGVVLIVISPLVRKLMHGVK